MLTDDCDKCSDSDAFVNEPDWESAIKISSCLNSMVIRITDKTWDFFKNNYFHGKMLIDNIDDSAIAYMKI